jgi:hypothetical protein
MSDQNCSIYVRDEATYIFPEGFTAERRHVPCAPVVLAAPANDSALLGDSVLRALGLAGQSMPVSEWPTYDSVVRALGFPTFGRFDRGAKHRQLSANDNALTVTPMLAGRGVWWPAARSFTCALTAEAIGSAVADALLLCTDDGKDQVPPVPAKDARVLRDYPVSFGYKISWLAIHTADTTGVADRLGLRSPHAADWARGVEEGYGDGSIGERGVFVTPAVAGWTFVVSNALPDAYAPEWLPFLGELSKVLGEVQYFGTHRGVNYQA